MGCHQRGTPYRVARRPPVCLWRDPLQCPLFLAGPSPLPPPPIFQPVRLHSQQPAMTLPAAADASSEGPHSAGQQPATALPAATNAFGESLFGILAQVRPPRSAPVVAALARPQRGPVSAAPREARAWLPVRPPPGARLTRRQSSLPVRTAASRSPPRMAASSSRPSASPKRCACCSTEWSRAASRTARSRCSSARGPPQTLLPHGAAKVPHPWPCYALIPSRGDLLSQGLGCACPRAIALMEPAADRTNACRAAGGGVWRRGRPALPGGAQRPAAAAVRQPREGGCAGAGGLAPWSFSAKRGRCAERRCPVLPAWGQ